jgi:hypothetical protein
MTCPTGRSECARRYARAVGNPPVALGDMVGLPPAVRHRLREVVGVLADEPRAAAQLRRLLIEEGRWLARDPGLVELGAWLVDPCRGTELRRLGCAMLGLAPSLETVAQLAALVTDPATPAPVREEAIAALADRRLHARHPEAWWPADALQLADDVLWQLADAATSEGRITSARLPHALRHVASEAIAAVFARAPGLWGDALECFATPPLARVLYVSLDDIPPQHRLRALRLIAAALADEAVPLLLSRASATDGQEQLEALLLAITLGGESHLGRLEDVVKTAPQPERLRARARWHLAHPGVIPTLRGLRVARTIATLPPEHRADASARAVADLAALTRFARHSEPDVYELWAEMVRVANDPVAARELVAACPAARREVRDLLAIDLARRGRVGELVELAQAHGGEDVAALQLAIWGRPLAALELAAAARRHTPELACARALACFRAGRPDLTARVLADDLPPAEGTGTDHLEFPGDHERWLVDAGLASPALAALAAGHAAIVALAQPAAHDAEPDVASLEALTRLARRLGSFGIAGAIVYVARELPDREAVVAAIAGAGARVVAGPLPGIDFYVVGDAPAEVIVRLERMGARRFAPGEGA